MAKRYENIENINKLVTGGAVTELSQKVSAAEKVASDILKKLNDLDEAAKRRKIEEAEAAARAAQEEAARIAAEKAEKERREQEAKAQAEKTAELAKPVEKPAETPAKTDEKSAPVQAQKPVQSNSAAQQQRPAQPRPPVRQDNKTFINRDRKSTRLNSSHIH